MLPSEEWREPDLEGRYFIFFSPPTGNTRSIHSQASGAPPGTRPVSWVKLVVWRFGITLWALRRAPRRCSPFASGNGYHIRVPGVHEIRYCWWMPWTMVSKRQKRTQILPSGGKDKPNNSQITVTPTKICSPSVSPRRYQGSIHMVGYVVARLCRCMAHDLGGSSVMLDMARKWRARLLRTWKVESVLAGCP